MRSSVSSVSLLGLAKSRLKNRFQTASIIAEVMYKRICRQINGKGTGIAGVYCKIGLLLSGDITHDLTSSRVMAILNKSFCLSGGNVSKFSPQSVKPIPSLRMKIEPSSFLA